MLRVEWKPFSRTDPSQLRPKRITQMILGAVILIPVRLFALTILMMCFLASTTLDNSLMFMAGKYLSKCAAFILGMRVQHSYFPSRTKFDQNRHIKAPFIVANHLSYVELGILCSEYFPSWVAKKRVENMCLFGYISKCLDCVYVDRGSKEENHVSDIVTERANRYLTNQDCRQLVIFPEGTTTNGTAILKFKTGAFVPGVPVLPIGFRFMYHNFNPSWDTIPLHVHLFLLFASLYTRVELIHFPVYVPSEEEKADPCVYAENVNRMFSEALQLPICASTLSDKREYHRCILNGSIKNGWSTRIHEFDSS